MINKIILVCCNCRKLFEVEEAPLSKEMCPFCTSINHQPPKVFNSLADAFNYEMKDHWSVAVDCPELEEMVQAALCV
jgi:uncharacterized CHY-type Zn-finger protein